jgi:hypothetical protein
MKTTIDAFTYKFGKKVCYSLDPVTGAKPCRIELGDGVELRTGPPRPPKREAVVDGKKVSLSRLVADGKVTVAEDPPAVKAAKERAALAVAEAAKAKAAWDAAKEAAKQAAASVDEVATA